MKLDRNGHLWAASGWDGIYKLSDEIILDHFNTENSNIPINYTQQMEFANDGSVWFVHAQGGVSRYANGEIEDMTKYLKIPSSTSVNDIAFDNEDNIWLATSRGLGMFKNDSLTIFDMSDGLIRPEGNADVNVDKEGKKIR